MLHPSFTILQKNKAGQIAYIYAWDTSTSAPATGIASTITADISIDGSTPAATDDTNPTEVGSGAYYFELTQSETNGNLIILLPASTTTGVVISPVIISTIVSPYMWKRTA